MITFRRYFSQQQLLSFAVLLIAGAVFLYHSFTIINRHFEHEILEVHKVINNDSLPMPIVEVRFDSYRESNQSRPFAEMWYRALLNQEPLPDWAYVNGSIRMARWWEDYRTVPNKRLTQTSVPGFKLGTDKIAYV